MRKSNFDTERYLGSNSQILSFCVICFGFFTLLAFDGKVGEGRSMFVELTRYDLFAQYTPEARLLGGFMLLLGGTAYVIAFVMKNYL